MDQTPISDEFIDGACYHFKGAETVWIKQAKNGWEKRCATSMLNVSANGKYRCRPLLIFKGKACEKNAKIKKEMREYHSMVKVFWNEKAYCNAEIMLQWLKQLYRYATSGFAADKPSRLFSLDVFKGQKTSAIKQAFRDLNVIPFFISSGCTSYVQVLDVAINKPLKSRITALADQHYADNFEK